MALFLYQQLAEPTTIVAAAADPAQLDKWWQNASLPFRMRGRRTDGLTDRECLDPDPSQPKVLMDKWYVRPQDPPRQRQRVTTVLGWYTVDAKQLTLAERSSVDKWYTVPVPSPRQVQRTSTIQGWFVVDPKYLTLVQVDKWYVAPPGPPLPPKRLTDRDALDLSNTQIATPFNPSSGFPWPIPEPAPRQLRREVTFEGFFTIDSRISTVLPLDRWYRPLEPPPRQPKRLTDSECLDYGEGVFTAETSQLDKWWVATSLPTRPVPRTTDRDVGRPDFAQNFIGVLDPGAGFPWPTPEPPPRQPRRELYGDGWFAIDSRVGAVVPMDRWYLPIVDPPRQPQRATTVLGWQVVDARSLLDAETVQMDKWWRQTVEPPRQSQRVSSLQPTYTIDTTFFIEPPPTVILAGGVWKEAKRGLVWTEARRDITWTDK